MGWGVENTLYRAVLDYKGASMKPGEPGGPKWS